MNSIIQYILIFFIIWYIIGLILGIVYINNMNINDEPVSYLKCYKGLLLFGLLGPLCVLAG